MQGLVEWVTDNAETLYKEKTLLICWEHKTIPRIVEAFGLSPTQNPLCWGFKPQATVHFPTLTTILLDVHIVNTLKRAEQ
jgi:hypothetical protein